MADDILTAEPVWRDSVAEENRSGISKFETVDSLAKGYIELEKTMGSKVNMPGEDATPEQKSAFYSKIGCPETADGYDLPELPEGETYDEVVMGRLKTVAHEKGARNEVFSSLVSEYNDIAKEIKQAKIEADEVEYTRHKDEGDAILHQLMGANYDKDIELSKRAYTEYATPELRAILDQDKYASLKNEPEFIKMWLKVAEKQMDDTFIKGELPEVEKDGYVPSHPNSPDMYKNGEDEDSKKARAYFTKRGYSYS